MRKLCLWLILLLVPISASAEKRLLVGSDTPTIVCSSEEALASLFETILEAPLLKAEAAYRNPAGCSKHQINYIDVDEETHNVTPTDELPGYTHIVYVSFGSSCDNDGHHLGECHVLLVRSILFGVHGDFFKTVLVFRRTGALINLFQ